MLSYYLSFRTSETQEHSPIKKPRCHRVVRALDDSSDEEKVEGAQAHVNGEGKNGMNLSQTECCDKTAVGGHSTSENSSRETDDDAGKKSEIANPDHLPFPKRKTGESTLLSPWTSGPGSSKPQIRLIRG